MKLLRLIIFISCVNLIMPLYANNYEYDGNCRFKGMMDSFEKCLDDELHLYDKKLNKLYWKIYKKSPSSLLKKSEIEWVKFKETYCDYMGSIVNSGYFYPVVYKACLIKKTKARIDDLNSSVLYSKWFE